MVLQIKLVVVVVEFETSTSPKAPPPPTPGHLNFLRYAWSNSPSLLRKGPRWVSHCPPRASFFFIPSFPMIQRGLRGWKRNSPYTLRPNVVVNWLSQRRNVLKIIWCWRKVMFRTSKSKSGLYLSVMIIYFVLIKLGELYDVSEREPVPSRNQIRALAFFDYD